MRWWVGRLVFAAVLILIGVLVGTALTASEGPAPGWIAGQWRPIFPPGHDLITNEFAYRHPQQAGVHHSADWIVTSGSLFADGGSGSTGVIDGGSPDVDSRRATGSAVFRVVSQPANFGDVQVSLAVQISALTTTPRTPAQSYDGVHLFLHYQSPFELYTVDVCRRDDTLTIKRKVAKAGAPDGGIYTTLAQVPFVCPRQQWTEFRATVATKQDGVHLSLQGPNGPLIAAVDTAAVGSSPLRRPGRVGVRGDNTAFQFGAFTASSGAALVRGP